MKDKKRILVSGRQLGKTYLMNKLIKRECPDIKKRYFIDSSKFIDNEEVKNV